MYSCLCSSIPTLLQFATYLLPTTVCANLCIVLEALCVDEPLLAGADDDGLLGAPVVGGAVHVGFLQQDVTAQQLYHWGSNTAVTGSGELNDGLG